MKQETIQKIKDFRDSRDWKKFHNGKDLSISISLEASELLEIFQWSKEEVDKLDKIENIKEELADILIYCFMLADYYELNVDEIIESKLIKNLKKYPDGEKINLKEK
jgi:NTP pyrophosphatase (non-canonical NTP hydrolase)